MFSRRLVRSTVGLADFLAGLSPTSIGLSVLALKSASDAGDAVRTRRVALRTLDALSRSPRVLGGKVRSSRPRPPRRQVDERRAVAALADFQDALVPAGIHPFLMFGTLLGAIRRQGIIPGDGDVDLAVIGSDSAARIARLPEDAPFEVVRVHRHDRQPVKLVVRHRNGIELEIKVAEREPDGAIAWWTNTGHPFTFKKRFPGGFGIRPMQFLGLTVHVPDRAQEFLEWHYGPEWPVPDPDYHPVTSGPLHSPAHREYCRVTGPMHVVRMLHFGRPGKALAMARSMARLFPGDDLWPRFVTALEAALAESPVPKAAGRTGRQSAG